MPSLPVGEVCKSMANLTDTISGFSVLPLPRRGGIWRTVQGWDSFFYDRRSFWSTWGFLPRSLATQLCCQLLTDGGWGESGRLGKELGWAFSHQNKSLLWLNLGSSWFSFGQSGCIHSCGRVPLFSSLASAMCRRNQSLNIRTLRVPRWLRSG